MKKHRIMRVVALVCWALFVLSALAGAVGLSLSVLNPTLGSSNVLLYGSCVALCLCWAFQECADFASSRALAFRVVPVTSSPAASSPVVAETAPSENDAHGEEHQGASLS